LFIPAKHCQHHEVRMKQDNRKTTISASISMNILLIEKYELFNNPRESVYLKINEGGREIWQVTTSSI
jgi:hypothetical protein